ncbi:MBL fold metallo-hydrolase [Paenibacillus chitinolyticus]|uniref:MBL fold metallo-hydrolase n=1 Tax=Paenibacillus chitinolyticus TaxID=79263 RepID=UPI00363D487B
MENTFEDKRLPVTSVKSGEGLEAAPDIYCLTLQIVNVVFVGEVSNPQGWVLVDAGMPRSADEIIQAAEKRFGTVPPRAIVLTHGHFDHVGAIIPLLKRWDVPVYAHELEIPYLNGMQDYPPADPNADSGLVARMSPVFPNEGIDLGSYLRKLPSDGSIPEMQDWRWIHTPGHTPGHISLFRDEGKALIAGDAFVNVKQESLYKVIMQTPEVNGPPKYFTTDWEAAKISVRFLEGLQPSLAVTGHGRPVSGQELAEGLRTLSEHFEERAMPEKK